MFSLPTSHRILLSVGLLFIISAYIAVFQAKNGLEERIFEYNEVPMRYIGPENTTNSLPAVIIGHGFAGSQQLMLGYAYTFAHAGYATLLLDFSGHARNPNPINFDERNSVLQNDLNAAYEALLEQENIDPTRIALLGHSMGSGAVLQQSVNHPNRYQATIAISPAFRDLEINDSIPYNLHIQAGSLEKPFVRNAEKLFEMGGGENLDFRMNKAREIKIIPNVEHISILFSQKSHQEALAWLNQSLNYQQSSDYRDHRMLWFGLHVLGWLMVILSIKPILDRWRDENIEILPIIRKTWIYLALIISPILAALIMALIALIYPDIGGLGGLLVGGAFALWFFIGGIMWLFVSVKLQMPSKQEVIMGLLLFCLLSMAFGYMAQIVWLPYFLIPERLIRWVFIAIACVPFFLCSGYLLSGQSLLKRLGIWLGISLSLLIGTLALINLVPGTGFLILVAPVVPFILGIIVITGSVFRHPWTFAIGGAMFFAWQLSMIFPLN